MDWPLRIRGPAKAVGKSAMIEIETININVDFHEAIIPPETSKATLDCSAATFVPTF